ncbi:MAG: polysaccharide biosynthesis/export family protein [Brevundimonas sp.]
MTRASLLVLSLSAGLLAACGGPKMDISTMTAARPVDFGSPADVTLQGQYRIGPGDELNVRVFQVEDLSFEKINVDAAGDLQMPLIGAVRAAGRTPVELASDIAGRLSSQYLRNPQVTVTVNEAASQKITVDGAVTKPGVYTMRGTTSLLQAVAMAEGPSRTADLTKVAVFRTIEGQRSVAVFDLQAIRQGRLDDPRVLGDDVIVVDTSRMSAAMREIVGVLPALAIFRPY